MVAGRFTGAEIDVRGAPGEEPFDGIVVCGDGLGHRLVQLGDRFEYYGFHDRVPVGEVSVDRRRGDADLAGHRAQGHGLVGAGAHDQGGRRPDDVLAQPGAFAPAVAGACGHRCARVG